MNWIISKSEKLEFHTNLSTVLSPLEKYLEEYQFFISDYLFISKGKNLPLKNFKNNYEILAIEDFRKILENKVQFIWVYLSAIPKNKIIEVDEQNLPYVEGNPEIWNPEMQMQNAVFEIYAYDSTYTIIKFKNKELSNLFKEHFIEAEHLEEYEF